ncbi:hypothetical protein MMC12_006863 [Toensbergia leucococca]|nr:hypothetical protein [Toensbergia leucococca]
MTTLTGDKPAEVKVEEQGGKLAGWFKGESEAVNISILPSPTKEKADPMEVLSKHSTIRPASNVRARPLSQAPVAPTLTPTRRFSFFGAKVASPKLPVHRPFLDDELLDLDIHSALLPAGPPDIVTPASFKTLLHNAESVLSRLQAVCRQRTISLEDMTVETETQTEELKGADTRARHLKMQLDDMAAEVLEQNKAMMNLVDELAKEKELRRQEDDARKRSVMLVKSSRVDSMSKNGSRKSRCSLASDSGFESEEDSFTDSVFTTQQGATSPTRTLSSASSTHSPETYHHFQVPALPTKMQGARNRPITNAPLSSTYQRLMKESSMPDGFNFPPLGSEEPLRWSCANCSGIKASEAFSVVGVLKEENKVLKQRVGQMESALDGCLELVDKLGL